MSSVLLLRRRVLYRQGFIEMVIWRLHRSVPASSHCYKYRLADIEKAAL